MRKCIHCGGRLYRVHRTFSQRLRYLALWECDQCQKTIALPRRYATHFGPHCVCPLCVTARVTRLEKPDRIDPLLGGFLNFLERLAGGRLYHCRYCRIQFYDRRLLASEIGAPESDPRQPAVIVTSPPNTASSDA